MSLLQSFRNLSPRMRLGVGVGILAWGLVGLQLSNYAEERFKLKAASEDNQAALEQTLPNVTVMDRDRDDKSR